MAKFIQTAEGRVENNGGIWEYQYDLKDHLGNVRVSFDKNPSTGVARIIQKDDYYPFGLTYSSPNAGENKYLYNGKELQQETDWYDYGARMYMADLGRWTSLDPLAEKYLDSSPYHYVKNNPIIYIDPNGMENSIYLYGADGVDKRTLRKIKRELNSNFRELGLKTRARIVKEIPQSSDLDKSDSFAFIGNTQQITEFNSKDESGYDKLSLSTNAVGQASMEGDGGHNGNIIFLNTERLDSEMEKNSSFYNQGRDETAADIIFHESGHNSGLWHSDVIRSPFVVKSNASLQTWLDQPGTYDHYDDQRYSFMGTILSSNEKVNGLTQSYYSSRMTNEQRKVFTRKFKGKSRNNLKHKK